MMDSLYNDLRDSASHRGSNAAWISSRILVGFHPPNTRWPCDRTYFQTYDQDLVATTHCKWFCNQKDNGWQLRTVRSDAADLMYRDELEKRLQGRKYSGKWGIPKGFPYIKTYFDLACSDRRKRVYLSDFTPRIRGHVRYGYRFKDDGPRQLLLFMTYRDMRYRPFVPRSPRRPRPTRAPLSQSPIGQPPHRDPGHVCPMASYVRDDAMTREQPANSETSTPRSQSGKPSFIRTFIDSILNR